VTVRQWSAGSYLEDQDMWWLSGLFRSVELLARPPGCVGDLFVHATPTARCASTPTSPRAWSSPELGIDAAAGRDGRGRARRAVERRAAAALRRRAAGRGRDRAAAIGFRTVAVEDGELRVNGRRVLLRGVNRHEWDPDRGRALTEDVMRRDVELMKATTSTRSARPTTRRTRASSSSATSTACT
jgi:beta-galactosidase